MKTKIFLFLLVSINGYTVSDLAPPHCIKSEENGRCLKCNTKYYLEADYLCLPCESTLCLYCDGTNECADCPQGVEEDEVCDQCIDPNEILVSRQCMPVRDVGCARPIDSETCLCETSSNCCYDYVGVYNSGKNNGKAECSVCATNMCASCPNDVCEECMGNYTVTEFIDNGVRKRYCLNYGSHLITTFATLLTFVLVI